jgi:outer membrane protein assembly factor BamB
MNLSNTTCLRLGVFAAITASLAAQSRPADFPQWRGANRDGVVASAGVPQSWPERLTRKWKVEVGLGYATPVLVGNRVFMFARQGENEVLEALDADTGKQIWESSYAATFTVNPAAARHD